MNKNPISKNKLPEVSIIIPTFNRGELISDAIDSIQAMSFTDWELIIVDDGSTDQTNKIVNKYNFIFGQLTFLIKSKSVQSNHQQYLHLYF